MVTIECKICENKIKIYPYQKGKTLFCSQKCWSKSCQNNKIVKYCLQCNQEFRTYPSQNCNFCSYLCKGKSMIGNSGYWKGKIRRSMIGDKNWSWKGGITPIKKLLRHSIPYKLWRKATFERDNYTCQECRQHSGYLEVHHIVPVKETFSRMFDFDNGITLCRPCHIKTMGKEKLFQNKYFEMANVC